MKRTLTTGLGLVVVLLAAACGSGEATTSAGASSAAGSSAAASARGPVTLDQCSGEKKDRKVTYDAVPQKVFALDPQSAEFLIALGLADRIVGTWGMYSEEELAKLPQYSGELRKLKNFDDKQTWPPPIETIAAAKADIVVSVYRLNTSGYLDAARMKKDVGIDAYSFTSYCHGEAMRSFDPLFADITNLGKIFDVDSAAEQLVATMQGQLDEAAKITAGRPRVKVWEYAGEEVPGPVGGTGIPNAIIHLAGGENIFEDLNTVYGEVSWEQVVQRNPDVLWLMTDAGAGAIQTEAALRKAVPAHTGLAGVAGVAKKRFVVVPYTTAGALSVHNASAVLDFAEQLRDITAAS
ncbi:MAG: ABC transporter substrate-binding protein [Kineosporiaceae bacterium]|nr:ABC transporter substrate-binding protein [Kineosporiaceae bacterium]